VQDDWQHGTSAPDVTRGRNQEMYGRIVEATQAIQACGRQSSQ
jgi:hypothetical protein